jgi:N-acetylglucosamine-6-sulfatase
VPLSRIARTGALALALLALGATTAATAEARAPGGRPNVVVLETDDQTAASLSAMPNVQRLLQDEGVTFDNSFVSYALCCPSRATFLTGQYAHNNGVADNVPPYGGYYRLDGSNTLPVWLSGAGYRTIHIGKYLNRYGTKDAREVPPGWTDWHGLVDPTTYRYYGFTMNDNGRLTTFPPTPENYSTDVLARKAVNLIGHASRGRRPFFMWTAFLAPHFSFGTIPEPDDPRLMHTPQPAPRDRNRFAGYPLPLTPAFSERNVRDKPATVRANRRISDRLRGAIQENYQQELETLQAVDRAVANIVEALRRAGELDRTYIVFTSDNGYYHGEHRVPREKILPYEPGIRVPLVIRGPGIPPGEHLSQLVSNQDLAPTILDATGVQPGLVQDGLSLLQLTRHRNLEPGRDLLIEGIYRSPRFGGFPGVGFAGIRTRQWFYAEYSNGQRELYDLIGDPYELKNRDLDPHYAGIEADLAHRLAGLRTCSGAACLAHPAISPVLRYRARVRGPGAPCARSSIRLRLRGPDRRRVKLVDVYANGRLVASGASGQRKFTIRRSRLPGGAVTLRPTAYLADDRAYTTTARVRVCGFNVLGRSGSRQGR